MTERKNTAALDGAMLPNNVQTLIRSAANELHATLAENENERRIRIAAGPRSARHALALSRAAAMAKPRRLPFGLLSDTRIVRSRLASSGIFSPIEYLALYPDLAAVAGDPLGHYVSFGRFEFRLPHPLFDPVWYLGTYPEVARSGLDPLSHYVLHGSSAGLQPNEAFDPQWYRTRYPDIAAAGAEPLAHYIAFGAAEGRWPHPLFDADWYAGVNDVTRTRPWAALAHFVATGGAAGARPNRYFDPTWYLEQHADVAAAGLSPLLHFQMNGAREGRNPSAEFDVAAYANEHRLEGEDRTNPLAWFLQHGREAGHAAPSVTGGASGRRTEVVARLDALVGIATDKERSKLEVPAKQVVFICDRCIGSTLYYRVENTLDALAELGVSVVEFDQSEIRNKLDLIERAETVVFSRVPWSPLTEQAIRSARRAGANTVFEIDDYVFDPEIANPTHVDALRTLSAEERKGYDFGVDVYRRMLLECEFGIFSTERLAKAAAELGRKAFIVPNMADRARVRQSEAAQARRAEQPDTGRVVIGYASGTKTHQRDFSIAAEAILRVMTEYPHVDLLVVGHLDLAEFPELAALSDRILRRPLVPLAQLPFELARFDVNIAPVEVGNPYCEAKSNIKYYEAALVGVPTVASGTEPFASSIVSGETGFVAYDRHDWYEALRQLCTDAALRARMGERARVDARRAFGPDAKREVVRTVFGALADARHARLAAREEASHVDGPTRAVAPSASEAAPARRLRIAWIVPGFIRGSGGHRNIFRAAHFLSRFGHAVTLYFIDTDETGTRLKELIHEHFYPFFGDVYRYDGIRRGEDVVIATHWSTVRYALELTGDVSKTFYFVQDYEPMFSPIGSDYILAENTYRLGLYGIASGPWCEVKLRADYGMEIDHFRFPIDRTIYHPRRTIERKAKRIIFFAKPEMPRRAFEIGLNALRLFQKRRPDVELVFFGSSNARHHVHDMKVVLKDVLPGINDLAELYCSGTLGIVFSTTNPSLVPYEMMSCGLPVVDLNRPGNEINYGGRHDIAYLLDPEPSVMAEQLSSVIDDEQELAARSRRGLEFAATFPEEEDMARRIEALIIGRLERLAEQQGASIEA